jgi:hypothetical protein
MADRFQGADRNQDVSDFPLERRFPALPASFHQGEGTAEPNWRSFAESIPDLFDEPYDGALPEAVRYILDHPPKKQIIADGNLAWNDSAADTDLQSDRVLIYVRASETIFFTEANSTADGSRRKEANFFCDIRSLYCGRAWMPPIRSGRLSTATNRCLRASEPIPPSDEPSRAQAPKSDVDHDRHDQRNKSRSSKRPG